MNGHALHIAFPRAELDQVPPYTLKDWTDMISLTAGTLSVRYSKLRDRLTHTIGIVVGDAYVPILEAIEGSAEAPWPPSPPMQQMVEESFTPDASPVLLGVGLSGNGHWSSAIETTQSCGLKFDIACKNSKNATDFGSQYRVLGDIQPSSRPNSIEIVLAATDRIANNENTRIEFAVTIGRMDFSCSEGHIKVSPMSDPNSLQTHRWCYEVSRLGLA